MMCSVRERPGRRVSVAVGFVVAVAVVPATLAAQAPLPAPARDAAARADEVLLVERGVDRVGRARAVRRLAAKKMTLTVEGLSAKDLAKRLTIATGNTLNFAVFTKDTPIDELPTVTCDLREHRVLSVLGVVSTLTELRFVYRAGVVLVKPKDEVVEQRVLRTYDLRAAVAPLRDHPGPKLGLGGVDEGFSDDDDLDSGKTLSGFTMDRIMDLVRNHVDPESWDADGVAMTESPAGVLNVRHTARNQRAVRKVLTTLGVLPAPIRVHRVPRPQPPRPGASRGGRSEPAKSGGSAAEKESAKTSRGRRSP